jgi:glycosyltransferase involved in cell wall biosynthesis
MSSRISIALPVYEMHGMGFQMLERCLNSIAIQEFDDFEVCVTDSSPDDELENLCKKYDHIVYSKCDKKSIGSNGNEAMSKCTGELVKVLYQDDYLYDSKSLGRISEAFDDKCFWLATGCVHDDGKQFVNPRKPSWNPEITVGSNTIGSPSVITVRNGTHIIFDENMKWLIDCDWYQQLFMKYGEPKILEDICTVIGLGPQQLSQNMPTEVRYAELLLMIDKYVKK